jgi:hypothetical protein
MQAKDARRLSPACAKASMGTKTSSKCPGDGTKKLTPQKSSTPHAFIHASIPSKLLTISQAFIHHTNLFQSINTPRCLTNYIHIYPRSCNCTKQDKKHLLAFLQLTSSIHAASYTRQAFLTLIPIKKWNRSPQVSSGTHCFASHVLPSFLLHHSKAGRSSMRHVLAMLLYHQVAAILRACKKRALPWHGTSTRDGCFFREQVDSTKARDGKTKACARQQDPEGAMYLLNTTTKREQECSSSLGQVQASIPLERGQPL